MKTLFSFKGNVLHIPNLYILFLLIYVSITFISCNPVGLSINSKTQGSIPEDDGYDYYYLNIPSSVRPNKTVLTFTIKANQPTSEEGDELFSDPDVYISLIHSKPNRTNSEWFSERYGSDILSISKNFIEPNKTFYIAVYCQFKCNYTLKIEDSKERELHSEKMYSIFLKKHSFLNYFIKIPNKAYTEFNIIATSPQLKEFKIFAHKDNPSSQHTFPVIPSWIGGYVISIDNKSSDYCENCEYHIILQAGEHDNVVVNLLFTFQDGVSQIKRGVNVYDTAKANQTRCYKFRFHSAMRRQNEQIIVESTLYSGFGTLHILGWNPPRDDQTFDTIQDSNYSFPVSGSKTILLNKTDYLYFDEHYISDDNQTTSTNLKAPYFYYCLYSKLKSSFTTSVKNLQDISRFQSHNYLIPGKEVTGFLMKNLLTSYRILDIKETSTITVVHEKMEGHSQIFGYYCSKAEGCVFNNAFFERQQKQNKLILPIEKHNGYELTISNKNNTCIDSAGVNTCSTTIVVKCFDTEGLCSFKLRSVHNDTVLLMVPRTSYYNLLPHGQYDKYKIIITDESIHSAVIVLNSVSGDAELFVYKIQEENGQKKLLGYSTLNNYIPDVVRIKPKCEVECESIIGEYLISVTSKMFSSYNLYYYTTFKHDATIKKPSLVDVTIELTEGNILQDHFPSDIQYKVYSFSPINYPAKPKEDIRIVLTRINLPYTFKVYLNLSTFEYNNNTKSQHQDTFKGYDWTANYNNELTISKNDPKYSLTGPYYIVVGKGMQFSNESIDNTTVGSYYIGATTEKTPFLLHEGKPHSSTLNTEYPKQLYGYMHYNTNKTFELNINVYHGQVNVYVYLDSYTSYSNDSMVAIRERINYHDTINISPEEMKLKCPDKTYCQTYIMITKSKKDSDGQYAVVAKAKDIKGEVMVPGSVIVGKVLQGESKHYYIEEYEKRKGSSLSVVFDNGYGDVYLRIPAKPENVSSMMFPNETYYDYKGEDSYLGKTIVLPPEVFQIITKDNPKIQLLLTVKPIGNHHLNKNESIEYVISYSSEPKRINQNVPYNNYIKTGEFQYFTFYFDNSTENIYISISNMNGDADIYLNYGDETFPTPSECTWVSLNLYHEFIQINKNDSFFISNNITSIGGYYTLLVYGYEETAYSLFVSSTNKPILPLYDNTPTSCKCYSSGDKCYFRYGNFYEYTNDGSDDAYVQVIFTSQYIYGTGIMYEKLYEDSEVMNAVNNIEDMFPNETNHDFSTKASRQRNYMKVTIDKKNNPKYTKDSMLLMTLNCFEPSLVEVNIATMIENEYDFLDQNRENIFYLKKSNKPTLLSFYNSLNLNLIVEVFAYVGSGNILIYSNSTVDNDDDDNEVYNYEEIAKYNVGAGVGFHHHMNTKQMVYTVIQNKPSFYENNIYFKVQPNEDFGFYIKIIYSQKWNAIPLNKAVPLIVDNNQMMGYVDIVEQYEDVEINVIIDDHLHKRAELYVKINAITKNFPLSKSFSSRDEEIYGYSVPSITNYDFRGESDPVLGSVLVTLKDLPKPKDKNVSIRALFYLILYNIDDSEYQDEEENEYVIPSSNTNPLESKITVLVTPSVNGYKRIDAVALNYYFTNQLTYNNILSTKIYALERMKTDDTVMIIEISSCSGEYDITITDELTSYNNETKVIPYVESKSNGRHIITVTNLKSKHYYLIVKAKSNSECSLYGSVCDDSNELNYFMYYYTTKPNYLKKSLLSGIISYESLGRGAIKINLPKLKERDIHGNERIIEDMSFDVIVSQNEDEFKRMESVCFLTQMIAKKNNNSRLYKNIKVNNNSIIIKGLHANEKYYVNVLAENKENKELITFRPLLIVPSGSGMPLWLGCLIMIGVVGLITVAVYFYRKYKITKTVLKYETSDVRNLSTIPRSEAEMVHIAVQSERSKYKNLSPDTDKL